jgi:hypothetical protein
MAMTLVHVILSGIVSLIPQPDGSFSIRLQDARSAHGHFPTLLLESKNVIAAPKADFRSSPKHPLYQAWLIDNGELIVARPPKPPLDASGLANVLRIADACPGENCGIAKSTLPTGVEITARGGLLATTGLEPYRYHFTNEDVSKARRIAEEVCWTFEIPTSVLVLSVPIPQEGTKTFRIKAQPGEDIEIRLQNAPMIDAIPQPGPGIPALDTHVNMYFELSANPPRSAIYLRPVVAPPLPIHESHRLAGRQIVRSLRQSPESLKPTPSWYEYDKLVRVDCPPALWEGIE